MLVRMIGEVSGTRDGAPWPKIGREIELPPGEAIPLIQAQMAVPVADVRVDVETAVLPSVSVEERVAGSPQDPVGTDPAAVVSNATRAEHRSALVKGNRKKVNPDIA